jgi:alkylated DNA repair dioxygenase AlkB
VPGSVDDFAAGIDPYNYDMSVAKTEAFFTGNSPEKGSRTPQNPRGMVQPDTLTFAQLAESSHFFENWRADAAVTHAFSLGSPVSWAGSAGPRDGEAGTVAPNSGRAAVARAMS